MCVAAPVFRRQQALISLAQFATEYDDDFGQGAGLDVFVLYAVDGDVPWFATAAGDRWLVTLGLK
ncbi:MAG: hypothetical protein LC776_12235 [Acidobacteria bacterium]|nr:hypothetical protein [Acidobacteriota bacterium]